MKRTQTKEPHQNRQGQTESHWTVATLFITCWWQTSKEMAGYSLMRPLKCSRNFDKLCLRRHAADAQVLQTNRSQNNRYKVKPNQNVCSAFPADSPDSDSVVPRFRSIRDLHRCVHADKHKHTLCAGHSLCWKVNVSLELNWISITFVNKATDRQTVCKLGGSKAL